MMPERFQFLPFSGEAGKWQASSGAKSNMRNIAFNAICRLPAGKVLVDC